MTGRIGGAWAGMMAAAALVATGAEAQVRTVDPNMAGALAAPRSASRAPAPTMTASPEPEEAPPPAPNDVPPPPPPAGSVPPPAAPAERAARAAAANTYKQQDVLTAADGVFGKGTADLARLLEKIFREQGQPTAYITGHEAGGAFIVGLRYGSGTLFHKIEGQRPVNWTGPSLGFDFGGSASKVFVLVYNLYDSQELYHRFPAVEGQVYVVGGFTASYLRWKDVVLIPIRLGVGWRLGANVGYMNFTEKMRLLPF